MAEELCNHTCSYYCVGNAHAIHALAIPGKAAAELKRIFEPYMAPYGWTVLSIRRAREADVAAWKQEMGQGFADDGYIDGIAPTEIPDDMEPWIILVAPCGVEL